MIPRPQYMAKRLEDLPRAEIRLRYRGVLLDVDNTLVPHHGTEMSPEVWGWVGGLVEAGMKVALATNATAARRLDLERRWGLDAFLAFKPLPFAILRQVRMWGLSPRRVLLVGDQVFTDRLAALFAGVHFAMVEPLSDRDFVVTRLVSRRLERWIYNRWARGSP
ncbi:YqeG family HAD IIIA-type phosphatase [bacterium]|nr:YqeG family HAD IIIA-type phosphatase [bacterium]